MRRPEVYLAPLRFLARERHEGRLWVATLIRLLRYTEMINALSITADGNAFSVTAPRPVEDPGEYFQGLTVYIDPMSPASIRYKDQQLPTFYNGPDETGAYSAMVPIGRHPDIW